MSSPVAEALRYRLERYYTRYYRDTLGIPGWRDIVAVRLADRAYEGRRLARFERAVGRAVRGARVLDAGCGTGGFSILAEEAGAEGWSAVAGLGKPRVLRLTECGALVGVAGGGVTRGVRGDAVRPLGGRLWRLVRIYIRLFGVNRFIELVAAREART